MERIAKVDSKTNRLGKQIDVEKYIAWQGNIVSCKWNIVMWNGFIQNYCIIVDNGQQATLMCKLVV